MSPWNSLPSRRTEHDESVAVAAAGGGDAHKHSSTRMTEVEQVLLIWRTQNLKAQEEEVHVPKVRRKRRKEEQDHMKNDDEAASCYYCCYDLGASYDNDPS